MTTFLRTVRGWPNIRTWCPSGSHAAAAPHGHGANAAWKLGGVPPTSAADGHNKDTFGQLSIQVSACVKILYAWVCVFVWVLNAVLPWVVGRWT